MQTLVKRIIAVVVVLALAGAAYGLVGRGGKSKKDEVTYETGKVERGEVKSFVTATGTITPPRIIDVKSDVAGKVMHLYVNLGSPVRKGQLIADIDPTDT